MKSEKETLKQLDAKLDTILFAGKRDDESHTARNVAIAGGAAGAVGAGGYFLNKHVIAPEKAALQAGEVMGATKEARSYADSLGVRGVNVGANPVAQKFMPAAEKVTTTDAIRSVAGKSGKVLKAKAVTAGEKLALLLKKAK